MDNRKAIGIVLIILGLAIIIGIVYIIFIYRFNQPAPVVNYPVTNNQPSQPVKPVVTEPQPKPAAVTPPVISRPAKKIEFGQDDLKRLASAFAERFGSFSNQSDYGNIRDLTIFMSSSMQAWADNYISQNRAKNTLNNIYYGITTKAVTAEVREFDNETGRAQILIGTQRREAAGSSINAASFNQDILISFIKERGAWKVESAYWQSR